MSIFCLVPCSKCSLYVLQHQPGLNTSPLIPTCGCCVVVAIAQNCGSSTTSNVFCQKINSSGTGEGKPFQLQKLENRSFWTNEEVTKEGLKVGCLLEYQVESSCQSHLRRSSKLFIFCGNVSCKPQVSFQQCSCQLIFEKLILSKCLGKFRPPLPPARLVFQFAFLVFFFFFNLTLSHVNSCKQTAFIMYSTRRGHFFYWPNPNLQ